MQLLVQLYTSFPASHAITKHMRIWHEGMTIGDRYDETLEEYVRNCSVFLLFVSGNSLRSFYCKEYEIP